MTSISLAIAVKEAAVGDKEKNLSVIEEVANSTDADMVIFPESFITGYAVRDAVFDLAETLDGPSARHLSSISEASGKCIITGMPEKDTQKRGLIYNSAVVAYPNGNIYSYRKNYLPNFGTFEEKLYYAEGRELPLFTYKGMRFGITICYDLFFPELSKQYALQGADAVINISASPTISRKFFEALIPARAIENTVFFAYSNNVGLQDNLEFWGGSRVYSPTGRLLAMAEPLERTVLETTLRLEDLEVARRNRPTIRDTRVELLESLYRSGM